MLYIKCFLFVFISLGAFFCTNTGNDCPFHSLESKSTYQRNEISSAFSDKVAATLKKLPTQAPVDAQLAAELAAELSYLTNEYRHQPIDTILAAHYNYQIGKICGLYNYVKELHDGDEKTRQQQVLSQAIKQLFEFMDDYNQPKCTARATYEAKIEDFLQEKVQNSADGGQRNTWIKIQKTMPRYLRDCETRPDCESCLEGLWQELMGLDNSSS